MEIHREVYNDLVKLYNKHTIERNNLSEEEFMEQLILYLVNIMENKQEYTTQYKNNPKLLIEAFYKFIELKEE